MKHNRRKEDKTCYIGYKDYISLKEELEALETKLDSSTKVTRGLVWFSIIIGILAEVLVSFYR